MPNLSNIRDHINSSQKNESSNIVLAEDIMNLTGLSVDEIIGLAKRLSLLPIKREVVLNVLDFDDTLYSRFNQLQFPIYQDNRGSEGNKVIRQKGIDNFVSKFYKRSGAVIKLLTILENQNHNHRSIILTAGENDLQKLRCKAVGIDGNKPKVVVVKESKNKPMKMLLEILEQGYIPGKIIVYEDRPEFFLGNNGRTLAKMLGIEIVVDHIFLRQDDTTKIAKIDQNIF
ncbi:MAG: hypothetical protein PHI37_02390 [Candidatus Gracilibacteria bacterium]|nr:hypothetical protein [Candidatus Gracilibacteria bacterium]